MKTIGKIVFFPLFIVGVAVFTIAVALTYPFLSLVGTQRILWGKSEPKDVDKPNLSRLRARAERMARRDKAGHK